MSNPEATQAAPPPSTFETIREALRGSTMDLTQMPVRRAVALLAIPMVIEMFMESLFAVVDIFWVSKLGSSAVAVVGLTETMLAIIYAAAMGLAMGATALVARRVGEGDLDGAAKSVVQILAIGTTVALVVGVAGAIAAPHLLALMGAERDVIAIGSGYAAVMLGGSVTVLLLFLINAIFRGAGDAAIAMRVLWLANGLNIVLGPIFIFGLGPVPEMGVTGAAVATTIGRGVGVIYQLTLLARGRGKIAIRREHLAIDPPVMAKFLRLSSGATLQSLVETASWVGLVRILAGFGSAALAGYTVAIRIALFAILPSFGIASAASTLVGQNLGAGRPERAEKSVWVAGHVNFVFLGLVSVFFIAAPGWFVNLFAVEPAATPYAVECLRSVAFGFLFFAYGMVLTQSFNGAGDVRTPMLLNLLCFWGIKIPLAWFLAEVVGLGPRGVFLAIAVAYSTLAIFGLVIFRRGKWKTQTV